MSRVQPVMLVFRGHNLPLLLMAEILHQLIGSLSHYLQGFIHPRWCRISAINSINALQVFGDIEAFPEQWRKADEDSLKS